MLPGLGGAESFGVRLLRESLGVRLCRVGSAGRLRREPARILDVRHAKVDAGLDRRTYPGDCVYTRIGFGRTIGERELGGELD